MTDITKYDDTIDVRDVIARVEELREERSALEDEMNETADGDAAVHDEAKSALGTWDAGEEGAELAMFEALLNDLEGYGGDEQWEGDWYPVSLIRDSYFVTAMQELVEDIRDMSKGFPAYLEIDWEATARNLQVDYSSVEFEDVTYWYR